MAEVLKEDDEKQNEEEIVIVEEDPSKKQAESGSDDDKTGEKDQESDIEDEKSAKKDDDDADSGEEGDDREAIRERRRLEKLERKERRERAIARDKLELDFLRKRNDELERRFSTTEKHIQTLSVAQIDQQIAKAKHDADMAERVIEKAIEAGNGKDATQAMRYRDQAMQQAFQLAQQKQAAMQQAQKPAGQLDDLTMHYAQEFIKENSWYDPQGRDEDSAIVLAIDQGLMRDGFDSKTPEYWDELRRRAARRLPGKITAHSDDDDDDRGSRQQQPQREQRKPRGGPAVGSGREHAPASTRKEVYISPERKQALIDAGVWDDPVLRMKYVKRYAEYDRQNKA